MSGTALTVGKIGYRPDEAARVMGVGRTTVYKLLRSRELAAKKIGAATIIPESELRRFLSSAADYTVRSA